MPLGSVMKLLLQRVRVMPARSRHLAFAALAATGLIGGIAKAVEAGPTASAPNATAPAAARPMSWNSLTPEQHAALAPLQPQWHKFDKSARSRWTQVADHLKDKPVPSVQRAQSRMQAWQHLSHDGREAARARFLAASKISPRERHRRWRLYQEHLRDRATQEASAASH